MPPKIEGWKFDTACGLFQIESLTQPVRDDNRNRWEYWIQFKWIDPNNADNRATPQYRIHLDLYEEDMLANDAEAKLREALRLWIDGAPYYDDPNLSFRTESVLLKERAKENSN